MTLGQKKALGFGQGSISKTILFPLYPYRQIVNQHLGNTYRRLVLAHCSFFGLRTQQMVQIGIKLQGYIFLLRQCGIP